MTGRQLKEMDDDLQSIKAGEKERISHFSRRTRYLEAGNLPPYPHARYPLYLKQTPSCRNTRNYS